MNISLFEVFEFSKLDWLVIYFSQLDVEPLMTFVLHKCVFLGEYIRRLDTLGFSLINSSSVTGSPAWTD